MPDEDRNAALLSSLRGLVRGLSALFWGLPAALLIAAQTGRGDWLKPLGFAPISGIWARADGEKAGPAVQGVDIPVQELEDYPVPCPTPAPSLRPPTRPCLHA